MFFPPAVELRIAGRRIERQTGRTLLHTSAITAPLASQSIPDFILSRRVFFSPCDHSLPVRCIVMDGIRAGIFLGALVCLFYCSSLPFFYLLWNLTDLSPFFILNFPSPRSLISRVEVLPTSLILQKHFPLHLEIKQGREGKECFPPSQQLRLHHSQEPAL